ncbi:hypothetical protein [Thioalkalivibrio sp. ALJ2]|uniref:hypothetical protein n=1 Tax=Thioalkalivibrio sp. ALJ2 TaxID=1261622 RepID=UPI00039E2BB5|nr:hypothetical protein [Thioalkalivibrio sp. ALJ2]
MPKITQALVAMALLSIAATSPAAASGGGSSANEGDVLRSGDRVQLATQSFATGCIGFRGLESSELQGYASVMDDDYPHRERMTLEARDRESWRSSETKRLDFSHRSEVHVVSGEVEITEIRYSGGGCPNRLGIR